MWVTKSEGEASRLYLHPGRLWVSAELCTVTTILGSCVAVCLWDPWLRAGGVSHYVLPHWAGPGQCSPRFGNLAIAQLIEQMMALGSRRPDLCAKVFGGARVLDCSPGEGTHLGARNVEVAREVLARERIPLIAEDVGGRGGRKLVFQTGDGSVQLRKLRGRTWLEPDAPQSTLDVPRPGGASATGFADS